jgi:hypothetical protein
LLAVLEDEVEVPGMEESLQLVFQYQSLFFFSSFFSISPNPLSKEEESCASMIEDLCHDFTAGKK